MTKEELIAKSGEMITEGFVNILLRAYDEGYNQGYEEGKTNQMKKTNLTKVRFFDFHLPSNTIWVTYKTDETSIFTYQQSVDLGLKLPTEEQALELSLLGGEYAQYDGLHHLHVIDTKKQVHALFYFYQGWRNCPYHYEGLAVWWKQEPDNNGEVDAIVLKYNDEDKLYYFEKEKININKNYLTLFIAPSTRIN